MNEELARLCRHEDAALEAWLHGLADGSAAVKGRPVREPTLISYRGTGVALFHFKDGCPWPEVSKSMLWTFINRPKPNGEPRAQNSVVQNRSAVVSLFRFLVDEGLIVGNPTLKLGSPGQAATDREPVADHIWNQVWEATKAPDDLLALGLGYFVGLRRSEIVSLPPHAVNPLAKEFVLKNRKGGKTHDGLEYGMLTKMLQTWKPEVAAGVPRWLELVETYARNRRDMPTLVPNTNAKGQPVRNTGQLFRDRLAHHILPEAGLPEDAFTPHQLRHSFATNMIQCGLPLVILADAMSHSQIDTTRQYVNMKGLVGEHYERELQRRGEADPGRLRAVSGD